MFSVVIPMYNKEELVRETIMSVLSQTFVDFEVIVVDDGSTDSSALVVEGIADSRVRIVRQRNMGVSTARNRGVAEAKFELVAFLDADDIWHPEYLETQRALVKIFPGSSIFACDYELLHEDGSRTSTRVEGLIFDSVMGEIDNYFEVARRSSPPITSASVVIRRQALEEVGGFPEGVEVGEDLLTWARLAAAFPVAYCRRPLVTYRRFATDEIKFDSGDGAGRGLRQLRTDYPLTPGLQEYVSLWYQMQTKSAMRLGQTTMAWQFGLQSLRFNKRNYRAVALMGLALLPRIVREWVFATRA